ncbi:hypothetical protein NQ318_017873, partial [Aromia moschata]
IELAIIFVFLGGIVSYTAPEGSEPSQGLYDSSYDGVRANGELSQGLGRLVDGDVGLDNFRLDIGYGKVFSRAKVMFSIGGRFYNGPTLSYTYMPDRVLENARNVSINLHQRLARFVRLRLFFADTRLMLSEVVFDSVPVPFNVSEEEVLDPSEKELIITSSGDKALEAFETIAARKEGDTYVEVIIGVLTAIMLLLLIIFVIILIVNKRHKLQGSPTLLRNPFGVTINMKARKLLRLFNVIFTIFSRIDRNFPNFQDLLMNLSSGSAPPAAPSRPVTPVSQREPSDADNRSSVSLRAVPIAAGGQLLRSPELRHVEVSVSSRRAGSVTRGPTTTRCGGSSYPPPRRHIVLIAASLQKSDLSSPNLISSFRCRSLQNTPALSPKSKMINLGNYFPRVATDPPNRKRYHTAPREKHRVHKMDSVSDFHSIAFAAAGGVLEHRPSMGHAYSCREVELVPIPRYALRPVEKLGSCHAGEITLYETEGLDDIIPGVCRLVAVRTQAPERAKSDATGAMESLREVRFLAGLSDANVCRVLGVCTAEQPPWTVVEYGEMGDLAQYLQFLVNRNGAVHPQDDQPISIGNLIFMATQIASGMKYLESKHVVHKDLAARNCLVGRGYVVKVADVAMCKPQYRKDYAEIGGRPPAPIRWLPWESILLDRYSCASTVWAFAVTLWEILGFCCERPFSNLSNEKVIQNAEHMYYGGELQVLLNKPTMCSSDIYDLMCSCWRRDDNDRPTFKQILVFLKHSNKDYIPAD